MLDQLPAIGEVMTTSDIKPQDQIVLPSIDATVQQNGEVSMPSAQEQNVVESTEKQKIKSLQHTPSPTFPSCSGCQWMQRSCKCPQAPATCHGPGQHNARLNDTCITGDSPHNVGSVSEQSPSYWVKHFDPFPMKSLHFNLCYNILTMATPARCPWSKCCPLLVLLTPPMATTGPWTCSHCGPIFWNSLLLSLCSHSIPRPFGINFSLEQPPLVTMLSSFYLNLLESTFLFGFANPTYISAHPAA